MRVEIALDPGAARLVRRCLHIGLWGNSEAEVIVSLMLQGLRHDAGRGLLMPELQKQIKEGQSG